MSTLAIPEFTELPPPTRPAGYSSHTGDPVADILPAGNGHARPRLSLRFANDEVVRHRVKAELPGRTWHPDLGVWSTPLTTGNCERARQCLGPQMAISERLASWYRDQKAIESAREAEKLAKLAAAERQREEEIQLAAERALYGDVSAVAPMLGGGVPGTGEEADPLVVGDPPPRIPLSECVPVDMSWMAAEDPKYAGDWRTAIQAEGASWLSLNRGGVLADEVGLGKSRLCIMAAMDIGRAMAGVHLIVAPKKPARLTWPDEIRRWAPKAAIIPWPVGVSSPAAAAERQAAITAALAAGQHRTTRPVFLVVNHDAPRLNPGLLDVQWASVIVDEAHEVLSVGNRGKTSTAKARAIRSLQVHPDEGMRVACTGTPFAGRLGNLWGLLDFVAPDRHGDRKTFTGAYTAPAGELGSGASLDRVAPGREAAWSSLMSGWVLRRTRTAAQRAMIENVVITVEPTARQLEQDERWRTRQLWSGRHVETEDAVPVGVNRPGRKTMSIMRDVTTGAVIPDVITAVTRRIQLAVGAMHGIDDESILDGSPAGYVPGGSAKVDALEALLDEWGLLMPEWWHLAGEHGKVIIASPWTSGLDLVQQMLRKHLPPEAVVRIDGSTSPSAMDAAKESFQGARGPGILLLSSTAGGAGLTLDQYCTREVLLSEHWTDDVQKQVVGRFANRTWETHRTVYRLRTRGMLDSYIGLRGAHQDSVQTSMLELASARAE